MQYWRSWIERGLVVEQQQKYSQFRIQNYSQFSERMQRRQTEESRAEGQESEVAGFIGKTFQILNIEEYQKVIQWSSNGLQFVIKDVAKLEEQILPRYFRHNKINSFVRQLNMYGFHKIKHTSLKSTFRHPHFQRGQSHLLPLVARKLKHPEPKQPLKVERLPPPKLDFFADQHSQDKWISTNEFLASAKLLHCDLVQVSCNYLADLATTLNIHQDCASIQDEIDRTERALQFQDPSCFFNSMFDLAAPQ